jgi:hypothetical protein
MRNVILFAVLFATLLFATPARAECAGGVCSLPGQPVARVANFVRSRPVARLVAARPVRSMFANRPVRRALRGVGSLFVR